MLVKKKGSNNYKKLENNINKLYDKCNNVRNDFLHELSTSIINENQVVVVENLNVKEMFQNKNIAKVLGDISISKFINMLEYKARWYGRKLMLRETKNKHQINDFLLKLEIYNIKIIYKTGVESNK